MSNLLSEADFTAEFCERAIAEHGGANNAAMALAPTCYAKSGSVTWRTVSRWIARRGIRRGIDRSKHPIIANAIPTDDINRLRNLLLKANVPIDAIRSIDKVKLTSHGVPMKLVTRDESGKVISEKPHIEVAHSTSLTLTPAWEDGPKWDLIAPVAREAISYIPSDRVPDPNCKRTFLWPDTQIGYYRNTDTGKLIPFHDLAAIDIALQMLADFGADEVVILGDLIDLPAHSKYVQLPEFAFTTNPALRYAYQVLARIRSIVGSDAKMVFIPGNHERRMSEYAVLNAKASYDLKPGWAPPESWGVASIPFLLGFDHLGIESMHEYPGGEYWIAKPKKGHRDGGLVAVHAPEDSIKRKLRASLVHGHHPQDRRDTTTVHYRDGRAEYSVTSIAGLMRCDHATDPKLLQSSSVPSTGLNLNWQQAVGTVLTYEDGYFDVRTHRIFDGTGVMGDRRYFGKAKRADFKAPAAA